MPMIPLGEWSPDQPDFQNSGSALIQNVLPKTVSSYGPAPATAPVTGALTARCQGAAFVRDKSANVWGFAGDVSKLYKNVSGSTAWVDVSKGGGYTVGADQVWNFAVFGERIIATDFSDNIQSYVMNVAAAFADLSAAAPKARYIARVKDWIMVANTSDGVSGAVPQRAWWCAIGDPTSWPTPGTAAAAQVQSDYNDLLGEGGWNQGIVGGLSGADAAIFQERSIYRVMYIGPPAIFSFTAVESARGTPAPGSIVSVGPVAYYLSDMGFYAFDGLQSIPIGQGKVDKTFWNDVDQSYLYRISAAADPLNKLIYWAYPGQGNTGGTPNKCMVYSYELKRWSQTIQSVEIMTRALTTGYTLDQLDPFGTLETLPFSLDSRAWTGGRLNLACFDTAHKTAFFSGMNLAATMETTEANINERGLTHINRAWPMADVSSAQIAIGSRNRLADQPTWTTPVSMTSTTGSCPVRNTAVFQRARLTIPAGALWNHAQGVELDARAAGKR